MSITLSADENMLTMLAMDGVSNAWELLIRRHNHRVVVYLLARGLPIDRAKELAQETWLRLIEQQRHRRLERLELPGLAIRQAGFLALEDARRQARVKRLLSETEPALNTRSDTEQAFLTQQQLTRAQATLEQCSPSAQEIFRLLYEDPERPHCEVAVEVGLSLQRVRQIICEVRKKLRSIIKD